MSEPNEPADAGSGDDIDSVSFEADDLSGAAEAAAQLEWEPTGDPRVDDAVARLADLPALPVDEHVAVFDEVARRLHDALAGITPES